MSYMLSTADNPYNPFTHFKEWYAFDTIKGYNTLSYLARIAHTSPSLTDEENEAITNQAIDEILDFNLTGNYIKVAHDEPVKYATADAF